MSVLFPHAFVKRGGDDVFTEYQLICQLTCPARPQVSLPLSLTLAPRPSTEYWVVFRFFPPHSLCIFLWTSHMQHLVVMYLATSHWNCFAYSSHAMIADLSKGGVSRNLLPSTTPRQISPRVKPIIWVFDETVQLLQLLRRVKGKQWPHHTCSCPQKIQSGLGAPLKTTCELSKLDTLGPGSGDSCFTHPIYFACNLRRQQQKKSLLRANICKTLPAYVYFLTVFLVESGEWIDISYVKMLHFFTHKGSGADIWAPCFEGCFP